MRESKSRVKNIKVSEQVHEELSVRKYQDETFDDVLKRELGLVPQSIRDLTSVLPDRLATAANLIVEDYIDDTNRYRKIGDHGGDKLQLQYISRETNKIIFEVVVYLPNPDRGTHRVDIIYRNPTNDLERLAQFRDSEENAVNIAEYKDSETHKKKGNTRKGENPGESAASLIGPHAAEFVNQAYDQWGKSSDKPE